MANKKKKKWIRLRHRIIIFIASIIMWPILKIKTRFTYKKFKRHEPYLVLYNHQTVYDQFFLGYVFNRKTYYVASDDLASIPFVSKVLAFAVHPIPYKKSSTDFNILRICKQVISEGGTIAISPEGNRTYSGETGYINPTIAKLVKFLKVPVAFVRISGGFGVQPRFANKPRKGDGCNIEVVKTLAVSEYENLSNEDLYKTIKDTLYVNESTPIGNYKSRHLAEYLERVIYYCPHCGITHFSSKGDILTCTTCGAAVKYLPNKQFELVSGDIKYANVLEWYKAQETYIKALDLTTISEEKIISQDMVTFFNVVPSKRKVRIAKIANLYLYKNRLVIKYGEESQEFLFSDITSAGVFGKNKFNIFLRNATYQLKGDVRLNALKYVHFIYRYKIDKGENQDEFLGL